VYETGDIEKKREVISSMYPEKLSFNGFSLRTTRINEAVRLIYALDKDFTQNKSRTNEKKYHLSCQVGAARFEPATSCSQSRRDNRATLRPENDTPPAVRRRN
jgi:site-specific DNA recombinase